MTALAELAGANHQPENPYVKLVDDQRIAHFSEVTLESGVTLHDVPLAYKTWGQLNEACNNCLIICHAFTGSADAEDWWGPLFGKGKTFDPTRFFIFCANALGSPYGSASPCTRDPETGEIYGPEFPLCTVRDDVRLQRQVLDALGVKQVACAVGGSMGGMHVLEWAFFGKEYIRTVVPIATSARASAWCISWGETQRQSIYCDPSYEDGYYKADTPPAIGLGAARMSALLTYRSRNSFESRFGRNQMTPKNNPFPDRPDSSAPTPADDHWVSHNEGHARRGASRPVARINSSTRSSRSSSFDSGSNLADSVSSVASIAGPRTSNGGASRPIGKHFSAQSYLRYQANKFVKRFDANAYISITRKIEAHDISRDRTSSVAEALAQLDQPALVLGIESDGLFTFSEQEEIAEHMPNATLDRIVSPEGHDGFLLEFGQLNEKVLRFQHQHLPDIVGDAPIAAIDDAPDASVGATKSSTFGEVDDITEW
ncbi:L-homoserine-O-acetyltransferase [Savitreella phatthalungensis]